MSYLVLARKYRPEGFDAFVGQDVVAETLRNAIKTDRVAHAYLFCGPRGVGKTSMARVFAKALNCVKGPTPDPCGTCERCQAIATGQDVDVIEIDGASNNGVDEVRDIRQNVRYAAQRSRFKIYYIDEVHMLSISAFNALLKTLEEPPAHVKFIFATTAPAKLPETILSRIQRFDFRRIANTDIVGKLKEICAAENVNAPDDVLLQIARRGRGSMRDALSLLDQILSFCGTTLDADAVATVLGALADDELAAVLDGVRTHDAAGLVRRVNDLLVRGLDVGDVVEQMIAYLRDLLVAHVCGADPDLLDRPKESAEALVEVAGRFDAEQLLYLGQVLTQAKRAVKDGHEPRIVLETSLVKMAQAGDLLSMGAVLERLAALEEALGSGDGYVSPPRPATGYDTGASTVVRESPAPGPGHSAPAASMTPPLGTGEGLWKQACGRITSKNLMLGSLLSNAELRAIENGVAVLTFPGDRRSHHDEIETPENRRLIEGILSDLHGSPVKIRVTNSNDGDTTPRPAEAPAVVKVSAAIAKNEIVRQALDLFGGSVVGEEQAHVTEDTVRSDHG